MKVTISTAEEADFGCGDYDTILFNGTPSYITDLESVVRKAYDALPEGGRIILIDVPKESTYGVLYNLAKALGTWDHPLLAGTYPGESLSDRIRPGRQLAHDGREDRAARKSRIPGSPLRPDPHHAPALLEPAGRAAVGRVRKGDYVAVTACK